jgi:RsiW-degrading membrane proteinase PrsW (M82 family)
MFCPRCGTESAPEHKFCKSCGAPLGAAGAAQNVAAGGAAPPAQAAAAPQWQSTPQAQQAPPPGMVPVLYQAYPGGPQQVYYMPASQVHGRAHQGVMEGLTSRIRRLASTDKLEGFSLGQMFSEVFKRRGHDAMEDYVMVGTVKTTPPLDLVETGWPKPWMFFRVLGTLWAGLALLALMFHFDNNPNLIPGLLLLGAFATPLATLTLFFELNTPRNVSMYMVAKLFITGAVLSLCAALILDSLSIFQIGEWEAGIVEECAKLFAVILVVRGVRFKYQLNGILFGATVGAGFSAFETMGYAFGINTGGFLLGFVQTLVKGATAQAGAGQTQQQALQQLLNLATNTGVSQMIQELLIRMFTAAPLGHMVWTAIAAGAFWRVKQDRPFSPTMLVDKSFLLTFLIPVALHAFWDAPIQLFSGFGNEIIAGLIGWYVLFTLVQQGLKQVKQEQMSHLQGALANVEATLGLGTYRQPVGAAPLA